jgi:glycosyltransferase involved in cell wall biosynthesis
MPIRLALITTDNREDRRDYTQSRPWFGSAVQALLDGFAQLPQDIEVHVISCARVSLPSPLQLAANITFHSVLIPSWAWLKTSYLVNILAVRRLLRKLRPDIVHGQGTERDCALCAVFSGRPNLVTVHGNMRRLAEVNQAPLVSFLRVAACLESLTIRLAGGVVCLSRHSESLVAPLAKQTWLIPNAVSLLPAPDYSHGPSEPRLILLVGDLLPHKNQLAFLEAVAPIQASLGFRVDLHGKADSRNPYAAAVLDFIAKHPWCRFKGFSPGEELGTALRKATVLVMPSLEENLPMALLEAMTLGLPVAAAGSGGIPDLIKDSKTGLLFDPRDPDSLRNALSKLLTDHLLRAALVEQARERILQEHRPVTIASTHLTIYRELLGKSEAMDRQAS